MTKQDFIKGFEEKYKEAKERLSSELKIDTSLSPKNQVKQLNELESKIMAEVLGTYLYTKLFKEEEE